MDSNRSEPKRGRLRPSAAVLFAALFLAGLGPAFAQTGWQEGSLGPGDLKLGKYFDVFPLELRAGDRLIVTLSSSDFDTYLLAEAPDGMEYENDDYGDSENSKLDLIVQTSGKWQVKVTSYEDGETGDYRLGIIRDRIGELKSFPGALEAKDPVSLKGEHYDTYDLTVGANQRIVLSLVSDDFNPFLVVQSPAGQLMVNDDYETGMESRLDFITETAGTWQVHVTSYGTGETGGYVLHAVKGGIMPPKTIRGELTEEDAEFEENGYFDPYPIRLRSGQYLVAEISSEEFDTYLAIEHPDGTVDENDDYNDRTDLSRLELFAPVDGEYTIKAGSYSTSDVGKYTLKLYQSGPVSGQQ